MPEVIRNLRGPFESLESERERIAAILSGMYEQLALVGADGLVYLANDAFCALFSLDPVALAGKPFSQLIKLPDLNAFVAKALASQRPEREELCIRENPQGKMFFLLSASPVLSSDGRFQGLVIIFHDITLEKQMEKMRRQFVDNVSHELKTPLSAIYAVVETLVEREPGDAGQRQRFYRLIKDNTKRLSNLINDLLDLSEIEQKKASLELAEQDLVEIVMECVEDHEPAARQKRHEIALDLPGYPVILRTDRKALAKAVGNLLDNAVKYTEEGGRITLRISPPTDGEVILTVQDTGIGIGPKYQERIFERFYRVDKARSIRSGGSGLGLSIVKHTIEALGGDVRLESELGKGSAFICRLPLGGPEGVAESSE